MQSKTLVSLILPACVVVAAACAPVAAVPAIPTLLDLPTAAAATAPAATAEPAIQQPTVEAQPTASSLPFTPALYDASSEGYQLEYPSDWTAVPVSAAGDRGSQGQLFSPGSSAETLAPGGTRMAMTVYEWDPKSNLIAFVLARKAAWESSGFTIVKDQAGDLQGGLPYASFIIQTPDGHQAFFLFSTLGEKYLEISGEGDLALAEQIARTVHPLQ